MRAERFGKALEEPAKTSTGLASTTPSSVPLVAKNQMSRKAAMK